MNIRLPNLKWNSIACIIALCTWLDFHMGRELSRSSNKKPFRHLISNYNPCLKEHLKSPWATTIVQW